MEQEKKWNHLYLFPVTFLYFEIFFRIFGGTAVLLNLIYPILFGVGIGLLFSVLTSVFSEKTNRIAAIVLLFAAGVLYIVECLIHRSMGFYMPIGAIGSVASDVAGDYMQQVVQTVVYSIPIVLVFFLPGNLYLVFGKKYLSAKRQTVRTALIWLACAVAFTGAGILWANVGTSSDKYRGQYKFDTATECFGLVSGMQLDLYYGLFGNDAADVLVIQTKNLVNGTGDSAEGAQGDTSADGTEADATADGTTGGTSMDGTATGDSADGTQKDDSTDGTTGGTADGSSGDGAEKVYEKNQMDLPLDEVSASTSDETLISMNEYVKSLPASSQNPYTGLFKGKNLILICAEAFSHAAVDPELTPTLYRLTHNGFYFSDFYQPYWGGSTSTGEYSMLMGIAPLRDIRTMPDTAGKNLYFTMGNQLQRLGYSGNAYHNGGYEYYSRHLTHQNLGYDEYVALGSGLEDLARWWPTDGEMFDATLPTYIDQQPFSVYYMTGSAHFPYEADNLKTTTNIEYVRSIMGDRYKDKTLYYFCYQMELEKGLASMVAQLEEKGIADDTVICITSDHYPYGLKKSSTYGNSQDYLEDLYGYYPQNPWERDRNAWILWSGCLENEYKELACEISDPTYSLDILPTLSNLFGLEYDSRLLAGRDVFSDAEPLVLWTDHSWVTKEGRYDANTGTFYPSEGSVADEAYVELMKMAVANKLSFSGKILSYDYYDILLGE